MIDTWHFTVSYDIIDVNYANEKDGYTFNWFEIKRNENLAEKSSNS